MVQNQVCPTLLHEADSGSSSPTSTAHSQGPPSPTSTAHSRDPPSPASAAHCWGPPSPASTAHSRGPPSPVSVVHSQKDGAPYAAGPSAAGPPGLGRGEDTSLPAQLGNAPCPQLRAATYGLVLGSRGPTGVVLGNTFVPMSPWTEEDSVVVRIPLSHGLGCVCALSSGCPGLLKRLGLAR